MEIPETSGYNQKISRLSTNGTTNTYGAIFWEYNNFFAFFTMYSSFHIFTSKRGGPGMQFP